MRRCLLIGMMLTALTVAFPARLPAEDHPPASKEHGGEGKTLRIENGLFKGALDLSLWTIVVFVVLMLVLRKYAWTPILEGLKQREEGIAGDKAEAEQARKLAADAKAEAEAERARARAEAGQMIAKAQQDAAAQAAEELARGKAELQAERDRLRREAVIDRDQGLQQIWNQGVQLGTLIAIKAVGKQLSFDDHRNLLNEALAEFRAAGQARLEDVESARA